MEIQVAIVRGTIPELQIVRLFDSSTALSKLLRRRCQKNTSAGDVRTVSASSDILLLSTGKLWSVALLGLHNPMPITSFGGR